MPNHDRSAAHSDTEILDLIEDFLVNHFAVEERQDIPQGPAFAMLEHLTVDTARRFFRAFLARIFPRETSLSGLSRPAA